MSIRLIAMAFSLLSVVSAAIAAEPFRLAGGETLELRAGNWDAPNKTFTNWDGISGSYLVGPDGTIFVPIAGSVEAVGKTTDEIAKVIAGRMQRIVGLTELPAVSLEISGYAPIFVGGSVSSPGRFDFTPGMTVEKALAVAGGLYRTLQNDVTQPSSLSRISEEISRLRGTAASLAEQETRLTQELDLYAQGQLPETIEPASTDPVQAKILEANIQVVKAEIHSLKDLRNLLGEKVSQLTEEIALRDEQIGLARQDLESVEHLKDRGLAVSTRVSAVNSNLNDLEAKRLQLEVARLDAQQRLNLALRDEETLLDRTRARRLAELTEVQSKRFDVLSRLELARKLYTETLASLPADTAEDMDVLVPAFSVTRLIEGNTERIDVKLTDLLQPGDSLTITMTSSEILSE